MYYPINGGCLDDLAQPPAVRRPVFFRQERALCGYHALQEKRKENPCDDVDENAGNQR